PIDIQVIGFNAEGNQRYADALYEKLKHVPGITDLRIHQTSTLPELDVEVDRSRARDLGLTQRDVAGNLLLSLSGSSQTSPAFWLNPKNGISYNLVAQTPQYRMDSLQALENVPINGPAGTKPQILDA